MAGKNVHEFTDANFKNEVLDSDKPVLVDFWAVWCGPCRAVAPVVEELANDYDGKVKVGKVDVDHNRDVAAKYAIRSIPTLLLFKNGQVVSQRVGAAGKKELEKLIQNAL